MRLKEEERPKGTFVIIMVFFVTMVVYYFFNWMMLGNVWEVGQILGK